MLELQHVQKDPSTSEPIPPEPLPTDTGQTSGRASDARVARSLGTQSGTGSFLWALQRARKGERRGRCLSGRVEGERRGEGGEVSGIQVSRREREPFPERPRWTAAQEGARGSGSFKGGAPRGPPGKAGRKETWVFASLRGSCLGKGLRFLRPSRSPSCSY